MGSKREAQANLIRFLPRLTTYITAEFIRQADQGSTIQGTDWEKYKPVSQGPSKLRLSRWREQNNKTADMVISSQSEETTTLLHLLSYNPRCTSYTTNKPEILHWTFWEVVPQSWQPTKIRSYLKNLFHD